MRRNFAVGETAFVEWRDDAAANRYELYHPDGSSEQVRIDKSSLLYGFTDTPGHYRLRAMGSSNDVRGFSVHLATGATSLERVDEGKLNEYLAKAIMLSPIA